MTEPTDALIGTTQDGRTFLVSDDAIAVTPDDKDATDLVEEPGKVMRIGRMISRLLAEVKDAPLDDASRRRLSEIYATSIDELKAGLSPELADELARVATPFNTDTTPSDAELRVAQAQLVGWLEGLFQGIQTALVAQQMAAQSQLAQMRRPLPGPASDDQSEHNGGMYL